MPSFISAIYPKTSFLILRSVPIKKSYSLFQSALVGGQNGILVLGLYHFVSEEFDDNIAYCISIVRSKVKGENYSNFEKIC